MLKTRKIGAILMVILAVMFTLTVFVPSIRATDVKITSISPATHSAKVGDQVIVVGTINTTGGQYRLFVGNKLVNETNAINFNVSATFTAPPLPMGNYTLTLQDVSKNLNATTWFILQPAYSVKAILPQSPTQLQENDTVNILVNVTGGAVNTVYSANVTVKVPSPANATHWSLVTLTNTTMTGNGSAMISYPDSFTGSAQTNYNGTYTVAFNKTATATLATGTFSVGLTSSTQYHRSQVVDIKAAYKPNENVTLKITGKNLNKIANVTASSTGIVHYVNFSVPPNAAIGSYRINITSVSHLTVKNPPDVQNFSVPGFDVNVTARNLAGDAVKNVNLRIVENGTLVASGNSSSDGLVQAKLEVGNYNGTAYYRGEKVGTHLINITSSTSLNFNCSLSNLNVSVAAIVNAVRVPIPNINIYLSVENKTITTGLNGTAVARSLLPNRSYTLNVSRYGFLFNTTTIPMPAVAWLNETFLVPNATLSVYVTDRQNVTIKDTLLVRVNEFSGVLFTAMNTTDGAVTFPSVIGRYRIAIFGTAGNGSLELNETTLDVFQSKAVFIPCSLYGLNVSVRVVDFLGQLIPNTNVVILQENLMYTPSSTSGGVSAFTKVVGGDLQIEAYLSGHSQPDERITVYVTSSNVIEIKLEQYVQLAGFLVGTSQFATALIIVLVLLAVVTIEVYKRRHSKKQKSSG